MLSVNNTSQIKSRILSLVGEGHTLSPHTVKLTIPYDSILWRASSAEDIAELVEEMFNSGEMPGYDRITVRRDEGHEPCSPWAGYAYVKAADEDTLADRIPEDKTPIPDLGNVFTPSDVQIVKETNTMFRIPGSDIPRDRVMEETEEVQKDATDVDYAELVRKAIEDACASTDKFVAMPIPIVSAKPTDPVGPSIFVEPSYAKSSGSTTVVNIGSGGIPETITKDGPLDPMSEMLYFIDGHGSLCIPGRELKKIGAVPGDQLHLLAERKRVTICKNNPIVGGYNNVVESTGIVRINRMIISDAGLGSDPILILEHDNDALYLRPSDLGVNT